jgi:hypothetical protein
LRNSPRANEDTTCDRAEVAPRKEMQGEVVPRSRGDFRVVGADQVTPTLIFAPLVLVQPRSQFKVGSGVRSAWLSDALGVGY